MSDSRNDYLRPSQLVGVWGVGERRVREILAEVEALGFRLETETGGVRLCPPGLAAAVKECRQEKRELSAMRLDPSMSRFLTRGAGTDELDPLAVLIYVATEVSICREVVAAMANALTTGMAASSYRPFSWSNCALPDPKDGL